MNITVNQQELAATLAALRFWQQELHDNEGDYPGEFWNIASDGGTCEPLDEVQIDVLCENINCNDATLSSDDEQRRMNIVELTKSIHYSEGEVEIDEDAKLSEGDANGCYVSAWVWCPFEGTEFDKEVPDEN